MSKERVFYLDFIRAFSTLLIVLTHYNALFIYNVNRPSSAVITLNIGNVYIGALGVSLFLIISGAAMMYVYGDREKVNWKTFYYKRFVTIYPMFWLAYLAVASFTFLEQKGINPFIPRKNFIFSILGFDTYLANFQIKTFCHVGEWFLGLIIFIYIAFPLLLKLIKQAPIILAISAIVIYSLSLITFKDESWCGIFFTTRLPEFLFGMYFIKYRKTKLDIMELIDKLNTDNPKTLVEFKEYLVYEKTNYLETSFNFMNKKLIQKAEQLWKVNKEESEYKFRKIILFTLLFKDINFL